MLQLLQVDPDYELELILSDMHTSKEFGCTAEEVLEWLPGVRTHLIDMATGQGDDPVIRIMNLSVCLREVAKILAQTRPDLVMVHGDRGEHLMVAIACQYLRTPVVHTQGGDVSGNIDEIQRHTITKLAHLHFPETATAAERIKKLGEEKWRIHTVGSLYVDRIVKKMYPPPSSVKARYGLEVEEPYGIVIFHPETELSREENYRAMRSILTAAKDLGVRFIIIYPCSDPGYAGIIHAISEVTHDQTFLVFKNIASLDFLSLMSGAKILIGNSSAAFKEAPYLKLRAVNVGMRQGGREREENVMDASADPEAILRAVSHVWEDKDFQNAIDHCGYHLGDGFTSERILDVLRAVPLDERLLRKKSVSISS